MRSIPGIIDLIKGIYINLGLRPRSICIFSQIDKTMHWPTGKGYNCFIICFSVPNSHLYVKFGEGIVELTTCKVFKITIFFRWQFIYSENMFTDATVLFFVLEAATPSNKASKSSPVTVAISLSAILNWSKHWRYSLFLVIPSLSTKMHVLQVDIVFYRV